MKCSIHDDRNWFGQCSCSHIVKHLRVENAGLEKYVLEAIDARNDRVHFDPVFIALNAEVKRLTAALAEMTAARNSVALELRATLGGYADVETMLRCERAVGETK